MLYLKLATKVLALFLAVVVPGLVCAQGNSQALPAIDLSSLQAPAKGLRMSVDLSIGSGVPVLIGGTTVARDPNRNLVSENEVIQLTASKRLTEKMDMSVSLGYGRSRGSSGADERQQFVSPVTLGFTYLLHSSNESRTFLSSSVNVYEPGNYGSKGRLFGGGGVGVSRTDIIDPIYLSYGINLSALRARKDREIVPYRTAVSFFGGVGFAVNSRVQLSAGLNVGQSFNPDSRLFDTSDRRSVGLALGVGVLHPSGEQTSANISFNPSRGNVSFIISRGFDAFVK